jgi:RecJ-like exonuclease
VVLCFVTLVTGLLSSCEDLAGGTDTLENQENQEQLCGFCKGTGIVSSLAGDFTCTECGGDGKIEI